VLWKVLLLASALLFVVKLLFRARFRQWGEKLDRAVNVALVAIVVSYSLYFIWLMLGSPDLPR
jgi:hypothetical protein